MLSLMYIFYENKMALAAVAAFVSDSYRFALGAVSTVHKLVKKLVEVFLFKILCLNSNTMEHQFKFL